MSSVIYTSYFDQFNIPLPTEQDNIVFLFDIDGVVCEAIPRDLEKTLTEDQYYQHIKTKQCLPIFLNTIMKIQQCEINYHRFPIMFSTGRKKTSQNQAITEKMFVECGLKHLRGGVLYFPPQGQWYTDDYLHHKEKSIRDILRNEHLHLDKLYYFEDNEEIVTKINALFQHDLRVKTFYVKNK